MEYISQKVAAYGQFVLVLCKRNVSTYVFVCVCERESVCVCESGPVGHCTILPAFSALLSMRVHFTKKRDKSLQLCSYDSSVFTQRSGFYNSPCPLLRQSVDSA